MLIRNAELWGHGLTADVRVSTGKIAQIGKLVPAEGEAVLDAAGGALLPGLHDHHIHLAALAVAKTSVTCGPPEVCDAAALTARLRAVPGHGWIRGTGFHESVLGGLPDARALDALVRDRPLRIQHRSGRMWLLNSAAVEILLSRGAAHVGLEEDGGRFTGRLFEEDVWLQRTLGSVPPDFADVSSTLARHGVTGITDMSPRNDPAMAAHFAAQRASGDLLQRCVLAGSLALAEAAPRGWRLGPAKLHLHESALPEFDQAAAFIAAAHAQVRPVAVHCVSEVELVFALAALEAAGTICGDRIEHVSVAAPELVDRMAQLGLHACVQPHFIQERGDRYLIDVEDRHRPDLYRLRTLARCGIPLAGGSDAPYGREDPWASMAAAVSRRTAGGTAIGLEEALTPEQALALYLADPMDFRVLRELKPGAAGDLCLLDRPWNAARLRLSSADVAATFIAGRVVHQRIDQPPCQRVASTDPAAREN